MSLSAPRLIFGVHAFTPYSRTDGVPYGTIKVLKSSSLVLSGALVDLLGGSSKYPWASEPGPISAELQLKGNAYADFLFTLFLGYAPTTTAAQTTGSVTTLTNKNGTSVKSATTGITSVTIKSGSDADLKFGKYVVKAASATTVNVYLLGDVDIARGTDGTMQDDNLKITATALTITASTGVDIPSFGLTLTGGSGTIGMTTGDTATFSVLPDNTTSTAVNIGSSAGTLFPEFGAILHAAKRGDQELNEIDVYRCIGSGMPVNFNENAWSEYDIKVKCLYDSAQDGVFGYRYVFPSNT